MSREEKLEAIRLAMADRRVVKVSEATGIHRKTIYNILNQHGRKPLIGTINTLAAYLGVEG